MYDLIQFASEIVTSIMKHGLSLTTLAVAITALLRVQGVRRILLKRLPKRFRQEDKLDRIERKLDALMSAGGTLWNAESNTSSIVTANRSTTLSQGVGSYAHFAKLRTDLKEISYSRGNNKMLKKFTSRKFILAVTGAILIILNDGLDLGIDSETVLAFAGLLAIWITGETAIDTARAAKQEVKNDPTYTDPGAAE